MVAFTAQDEELDENKDQEGSTSLSGPVSFSGGGGGGNAKTGASSATPSRFVSFDRYFNANAGGANAMADKALSGVTDQINAANTGLQSEQNTFQEAVNNGRTRPTVQAGYGMSYNAVPGSYTGPKEFTPSQGVRDNLTNAYSALENLRTPEGLQSTLPKSGTAGNDRFNAFLTSQAGQSRFDSLWNQYSGMNNAVADSMTQGQQTIDDAMDTNNEWNADAQRQAEMYTQSGNQALADAEQDNQEVDERIKEGNGGKERGSRRGRRNILTD